MLEKVMLLFNCISLILFFVLFIKNKNCKIFNDIDSKIHPLQSLYPLSLFIYHFIKKYYKKNKEDKLKKDLSLLHIESEEEILKFKLLHRCKQISMILLILVVSNIFSIILCIQEVNKISNDYIILKRNENGGGDKKQVLDIKILGENEEIEIDIKERKYTAEEIEIKFKEAFSYIDGALKGDNDNYDAISFPLNLVENIPNSSIKVEWKIEDSTLIDRNGNILVQEEKITSITAILRYREDIRMQEYGIKIVPYILSEKEKNIKLIKEKIEEIENENIESIEVRLPKNIENSAIVEKNDSKLLSVYIIIFGCFIAGLLYAKQEEEIKINLRIRSKEVELYYSEFINKILLLLQSGMTMKMAVARLAMDYTQVRGYKKSFLYEEILKAHYELEAGMSEITVYKEFGRRMKSPLYLKFSTLIVQNLMKGTKELLFLLEQEEENAIHKRQEQAKKLGEEAGTKLMFPMILLLIVIMALIIVPAFIGFQ